MLIGLGFAACARVQFLGGATPWGRELMAVLSFEAIIIWPISLYFYLVFPDWSWMYFVDPHRLPRGVSFLVLLAFVATLLGGYLSGWALLRARREKWLYGAMGGIFLLLLIFAIVCRGRLLSGGTFGEYHAGHALSITEGKLSWALAFTSIGVLSAIGLVAFTLWEQGKRFRS